MAQVRWSRRIGAGLGQQDFTGVGASAFGERAIENIGIYMTKCVVVPNAKDSDCRFKGIDKRLIGAVTAAV